MHLGSRRRTAVSNPPVAARIPEPWMERDRALEAQALFSAMHDCHTKIGGRADFEVI
jgi:hypothetical protein